MERYAADLQYYDAASDAHRQRDEVPKRKFDMGFQPKEKSVIELEKRRVAWRSNEIWSAICVVEWVLSKDPGNLFGYGRLDFDPKVPYDQLSSEKGRVDASATTKASGTTATAP